MKAVLMYHSIDSSGSVISIDPDVFAAHVKLLSARAQVVPLDKINDLPDDQPAVSLTFDDGFQNFAEMAWPQLREHGLPVTLFVVAGRAGQTNAWSAYDGIPVPQLPLADWDTLGRLAEEGVSIGAHTLSHPNLSLASASQVQDEIAGAAEIIAERIGTWPKALAYPYGSYNKRVAAAAALVHELACTTELRTLKAHEDPMRLPRVDTYYFRSAGRLEQYGTRPFQRYLSRRRAARSLRQVLVVHKGRRA